MKEFLIYTGLRVLLFVAVLGTIIGIWTLITGRPVNALYALIVALLISGVTSYFLLARQRLAFAARVEARAARATEAFERRTAREDYLDDEDR